MVQREFIRNIPADFYTRNHYIFGQVKVTNSGLLGLLADPTTSGLEVKEASLARIVKPDKVINYAPTMWVVKDQLIAVCLTKRDFVGTTSLIRGGYSRINNYSVQITTPVYEITGNLEFTGQFKFSVILGDGSNPFLLLFDATLVATLFPVLHCEAEALLVNRKAIDSLVQVKKDSQES